MFRALGDREGEERGDQARVVALDEWLAEVEMLRQVAIMQLRHYDAILVRHGRLRASTLPQRVK